MGRAECGQLASYDWVPDLAGELLDALRGVRRVTSMALACRPIVLEPGQPSGIVFAASPAEKRKISASEVVVAVLVGLLGRGLVLWCVRTLSLPVLPS